MWALVETALWFPSSGGRRVSVHRCGSVHAVVELRKDVRDLHHLTGHYPTMNAAIYARKNTAQDGVADEQKSVTRQTELAREFAGSKGWLAPSSSACSSAG